MNKIFMMFFSVFFCLSQIIALDFNTFKAAIVGKNGASVRAYIEPLLSQGLDAQILQLQNHMSARGHFGTKKEISKKNTTMRWNSFFVKPDCKALYSESEQKDLIKSVWQSEQLVYTGDVPGANNIVCLDGTIENVMGVAFSNKQAIRESVQNKDVDLYNKENLIAVKLASLKRIDPSYAPKREDFLDDEEFNIAQRVDLAAPKIVKNCTIRVALEVRDGTVRFNTSYPF